MRHDISLLARNIMILLCLCVAVYPQSDTSEFVSGIARFAIRVEGQPPSEIKSDSSRFPKYWLPGESFVWRLPERSISVSHFTPRPDVYVGPTLSAAAKLEILNSFRGIFRKEFEKNHSTVSEAPFLFLGFKGVEYRIGGKLNVVVRMFFVKDRFYSLIATGRTDATFESLGKSLESFRVLSKEEFIRALLRDHEPPELPQIIPPGIIPTTTIEMGLKGLVKEISEEIEMGTPPVRELHNVEKFNELGFLVKKVMYSGGIPDTVISYGWVDGQRAENLVPITYRGEGVGFGRSGTTVGWAAPEGGNVIGRDYTGRIVDRRYTSRYETIYDDEWRVKERRMLASNGDVTYVEKFTYSGPGRDIKTVDGLGGFMARKFEVLDAGGNVIEERALDNFGKQNSTTKFQYEIDAKGNWIVRRSSVLWKGKGKPGFRPNATYYRTIKYFE